MTLFAVCRKALLLSGLFVLGLTSAFAADWPRQVTDSRGTHTLESKPTRIVSTSVTLTGSLSGTMTSTLTYSAATVTLGATGGSFQVGGTLSVGANQAAGDYTGTFNVTANYL